MVFFLVSILLLGLDFFASDVQEHLTSRSASLRRRQGQGPPRTRCPARARPRQCPRTFFFKHQARAAKRPVPSGGFPDWPQNGRGTFFPGEATLIGWFFSRRHTGSTAPHSCQCGKPPTKGAKHSVRGPAAQRPRTSQKTPPLTLGPSAHGSSKRSEIGGLRPIPARAREGLKQDPFKGRRGPLKGPRGPLRRSGVL